MDNQQQSVLEAVKSLKHGQFKATAIKVELEAQLDREDSDNICERCDEGYITCQECGGCYDTVECSYCDGSGTIHNDATDRDEDCEECDGSGTGYCDFCEDGSVTCPDCDGHYEHGSGGDWSEESYCHDYLMEQLSHLGLAEFRDTNWDAGDFYSRWHPTGALKYAMFYNDHSVDSEFTFTLSLEHEEDVLLLPKIIDIWNDFAEKVGNGMRTNGAGMHMALINDPDCLYPTRSTDEQRARFYNFRKSMSLLLPALYFLGSPTAVSRGLRYRAPRIHASFDDDYDWRDNIKYSAIYYTNGALEFRVFETCYGQPDHILENLMVMSRAMRYWTSTYKPSGLERITNQVRFGSDEDDTLTRFYKTTTHLDLLNAGLQKLKPGHAQVRQLKQQRNFTLTKRTLEQRAKDMERQIANQYAEYKERFEWGLLVNRQRYIFEQLERQVSAINRRVNDSPTTKGELLLLIERKADEYIAQERQTLQDQATFVKERYDQWLHDNNGNYTLSTN